MADASPKRNGDAYSSPATTDLINSSMGFFFGGWGSVGGKGRWEVSKGYFFGPGEGSRMEVGPSSAKLVVSLLNFLILALKQTQAMFLCSAPFSSLHLSLWRRAR